MAYIKLGPAGNYFGSSRLGLYLSNGNAAQVDDGILYSLLSKFLLTGFFVIIDKDEFENIKIDRRALRGIPLQFVGVNQPTIIEPVVDYLNEPPVSYIVGDRFIVGNNPTGPWEGMKGMIVEYVGTSTESPWKLIQPENNMIVPVYNLGISTQYKGTYPSGKWDLTQKRIYELKTAFNEIIPDEPEDTTPWATRVWVTSAINEEATQRADGYQYLLTLIRAIQENPISAQRAAEILITDPGNYFQATNVEMALQELASDLKGTDINLQNITLLYQSLANQVESLVGSGGSGSSFTTRAFMYLDVDAINYGHMMGRIPIWQLYKFSPTGNNSVNANTVLSGVIAQPYRVTYNDIRFEFPKKYNLILILA